MDVCVEAAFGAEERLQKLLESLRAQIVESHEEQSVRIRQIFDWPREIYRIELELPLMGFQRTTLLDRTALEELLSDDGVRHAIEAGLDGPPDSLEGA